MTREFADLEKRLRETSQKGFLARCCRARTRSSIRSGARRRTRSTRSRTASATGSRRASGRRFHEELQRAIEVRLTAFRTVSAVADEVARTSAARPSGCGPIPRSARRGLGRGGVLPRQRGDARRSRGPAAVEPAVRAQARQERLLRRGRDLRRDQRGVPAGGRPGRAASAPRTRWRSCATCARGWRRWRRTPARRFAGAGLRSAHRRSSWRRATCSPRCERPRRDRRGGARRRVSDRDVQEHVARQVRARWSTSASCSPRSTRPSSTIRSVMPAARLLRRPGAALLGDEATEPAPAIRQVATRHRLHRRLGRGGHGRLLPGHAGHPALLLQAGQRRALQLLQDGQGASPTAATRCTSRRRGRTASRTSTRRSCARPRRSGRPRRRRRARLRARHADLGLRARRRSPVRVQGAARAATSGWWGRSGRGWGPIARPRSSRSGPSIPSLRDDLVAVGRRASRGADRDRAGPARRFRASSRRTSALGEQFAAGAGQRGRGRGAVPEGGEAGRRRAACRAAGPLAGGVAVVPDFVTTVGPFGAAVERGSRATGAGVRCGGDSTSRCPRRGGPRAELARSGRGGPASPAPRQCRWTGPSRYRPPRLRADRGPDRERGAAPRAGRPALGSAAAGLRCHVSPGSAAGAAQRVAGGGPVRAGPGHVAGRPGRHPGDRRPRALAPRGPAEPDLSRIYVLPQQSQSMPLSRDDLVRGVYHFVSTAYLAGLRQLDPIRARLEVPRQQHRLLATFAVAASDVDTGGSCTPSPGARR